jgi:hypothetical protein
VKIKIIFAGKGTKLSMIALDLADEEEAMVLARRLAKHTGRTVTVRDASGEILNAIEAVAKH